MPHKPQTEIHQELMILLFGVTNLIINLSVMARLIHSPCLQASNSTGLETKFSPVLFSDAMKYYSSKEYFKRRSKMYRKQTQLVWGRHCVDLIWREIYLSRRKNSYHYLK